MVHACAGSQVKGRVQRTKQVKRAGPCQLARQIKLVKGAGACVSIHLFPCAFYHLHILQAHAMLHACAQS